MFDDFMTRAAFAGVGVACAAAPLGCFVVWRRMVYFGDATAHASILGVALALALNISVFTGAMFIALAMAFLFSTLNGRNVAADALLGVLAHSALALGLLAASFMTGIRIDLMAYLLGDILAVGKTDLLVIWCGGLLVIGLLAWRWQALLTATMNPDLARAAGIDPKREEVVITFTLAVVVAIAIKVVGVLLIAALLLIPAAAARPLARTPEIMAVIAAFFGAGSALTGLGISYVADTPTGPTIVSIAAAVFVATSVLNALVARRRKS